MLQQLTDGPPFKRSIGYLARMVVAIAKYPCFAGGTARQRCDEQVGQTSAAPEPILIDRFESKWIQRCLIDSISPLSSSSQQAPDTGLACRRLKIAQGKRCEHLRRHRLTGKAAALGPDFDHRAVLVDRYLRGLTEVGNLYVF